MHLRCDRPGESQEAMDGKKKEKFSIFSSGPGLLLFCCFCFEAKRKSAGGFAGPPWFVRFLVWLFVLPKLRFCTLTFIQLFRTEPLTALREKKEASGVHIGCCLNPVEGGFLLFRFVRWLDCLLLKEGASAFLQP